jgi:hypothetical protein
LAGLLLLGQLLAGADHHDDQATDQDSDHANHEENTPREAGADPGYSRISRYVGGFLASLTGHQGWQVTHRQGGEEGKEPKHVVIFVYLGLRCKRLCQVLAEMGLLGGRAGRFACTCQVCLGKSLERQERIVE